jgi:hypothetical protein
MAAQAEQAELVRAARVEKMVFCPVETAPPAVPVPTAAPGGLAALVALSRVTAVPAALVVQEVQEAPPARERTVPTGYWRVRTAARVGMAGMAVQAGSEARGVWAVASGVTAPQALTVLEASAGWAGRAVKRARED